MQNDGVYLKIIWFANTSVQSASFDALGGIPDLIIQNVTGVDESTDCFFRIFHDSWS